MRFLIFCGIAILALVLAGCGGRDKAEEPDLTSYPGGSETEVTSDEGPSVEKPFEAPGSVTISELTRNKDLYLDKTVVVTGQFQGWKGVDSGPPVTRSDWVLKDKTGAIYVNGRFPPGCNPPDSGIGKTVTVKGVLKVSEKGNIYIKTR